jgi:type IV secretory pathway VirB10-like protein
MKVKPFFVVFPVLVGVIVYAYYAPKEKPEQATTLTPKQYIELVEKKKLEKKQAEKEPPAQAEQTGDKTNPAITPNN